MRKIYKAVIPAAGLGTRLYPASKAIKKEFFPVVDAQGIAKPTIQVIIEEAIDSGIEEVCLIVQKKDASLFREYFGDPLTGTLKERLAKHPEAAAQTEKLQDLDRRIDYVIQEEQEGFGHAVYCAKNWVGGAPFLLMLGDHIYRSHTQIHCASQVLEVYSQLKRSVYAIARTPGHKVERYGTIAGDPVLEWPRTYKLTEIREKPSLDYARVHLRAKGLGQDEFFCIFGQYALSPALFDYLEFHIDRGIRQRGEIQLTGALEMLMQEEGAYGYETAGERYDIGTPSEYVKTVAAFSAYPKPFL